MIKPCRTPQIAHSSRRDGVPGPLPESIIRRYGAPPRITYFDTFERSPMSRRNRPLCSRPIRNYIIPIYCRVFAAAGGGPLRPSFDPVSLA